MVACGRHGTYTASGFNTTAVGVNNTLPVSLYAGDQQSFSGHNALTQQSQNITYSVLGHANAALSIAAGNNQTIITGGTLAPVTLNLTDAGTNPRALDVNTLAISAAAQGAAVVACGGTATYTASGFNTATVASTSTLPVSLYAGDQQSLSGHNALAALTQDITYTVLDHADASVSASTVSIGRVMRNATAAASTTLSRRPGGLLSAHANHLAVLQLRRTGRPAVGNTIAAGGSKTLTICADTSAAGPYTSTATIGLSDQQCFAGWTALAPQTVTLTGTVLDNRVVTAAPSTWAASWPA